MRTIFLMILVSGILLNCEQTKKSSSIPTERPTTDQETETPTTNKQPTDDNEPRNEVTISKVDGFCKQSGFVDVYEQSDSLLSFYNQLQMDSLNQELFEQFFCAFPNSFVEMQGLFGYDRRKGAGPLYSMDNTGNYLNKRIFNDIIGLFTELKSIPDSIYYEKYININIGGIWEADNIRDAFGLQYQILDNPKIVCLALAEYSDQEIKSVFRFIFDGPHPINDYNENLYEELKPKIEAENNQLSGLLTEAYEELMAEDDGHGH